MKNKARQVFFSLANPFQFQETATDYCTARCDSPQQQDERNRSKSMEHKNKGYYRKELRLAL
jgi:hypothetical protein